MEPNLHDAERWYTPKEVAFLWNMSAESVRRLFLNEPGTVIVRIQRTGRRRYRTMRIPQDVLERVRRRMTVAAPDRPTDERTARGFGQRSAATRRRRA